MKLAESNSDADVKRVSEEAFKLVPSGLKAAITKMAELKGVGPATASGRKRVKICSFAGQGFLEFFLLLPSLSVSLSAFSPICSPGS